MEQTGAPEPLAAAPPPRQSPLGYPPRSPFFFPVRRKGTSISSGLVVNRHTLIDNLIREIRVWGMGKITIAFVLVIALLLIGGGIFLTLWNPPAPSAPVEKVLPDARFPK
jgi:hypothetical protein